MRRISGRGPPDSDRGNPLKSLHVEMAHVGIWVAKSQRQSKLSIAKIVYQRKTVSKGGARRSSVVKAFAHGAMGRRIDRSWGGPIELFLVPASAPRLV